MPDIAIEKSTFERLQRHARPLVDTTDTVINRALDALELRDGHTKPEENAAVVDRSVDPRKLPDLTHTKIRDALLAGQRVVRPNWNLLLEKALVLAMKQVENMDRLMHLCPANMVRGRKEDEGYRYVAEVDVSFQLMSANRVCEALVAVAGSLGIGLEITFMWPCKEGAEYPGETARLVLPG